MGTLRESGTAAISGKVVDSQTGRPLAGATVSLARTDVPASVVSARCDSQGRFVLMGLPASRRYSLKAAQPGYWQAYLGQRAPDASQSATPIEFEITDRQWRSDLSISLWRASSITGRVTDERGEALIGVAVRPFVTATVGGRRFFAGLDPTTTDDRGVYEFAMLGPGTYWVGIANPMVTVPSNLPEVPARRALGALYTSGPPDRGEPAVAGPALDSPDRRHRLVANPLSTAPPSMSGTLRVYEPVFYPSAPTPDSGQPIALEIGMDRRNIDFMLRAVSAYTIHGTTSTLPEKGSFPLLRLMRRGFEHLGLGNEVATAVLERNGSFTFLAVPAGDYTITAQSDVTELTWGLTRASLPVPAGIPDGATGNALITGAGGAGVRLRRSSTAGAWIWSPVSVPEANVDGLVVPLKSTVTIRGRIEGDAGVVLPEGQKRFFVTAEPADGDPLYGSPTADAEPGRSVPVPFSLDGVIPGRYVLRGSHFPVSTVTWQGRDITDAGVDATSGDITDVVITLTSQTSEVSGAIAGREKAAGRLMVMLFPTQSSAWSPSGWTPRRIRTVPVRGDGSYSVRNLPTGDYYIVCVEESAASLSAETLGRLARTAAKTRIEWGRQTTVDLTFRPEALR